MRKPAADNLRLGQVRKRDKSIGLPSSPIAPVPFDLADAGALRALRDGNAAPHQQQRALGWILFACGDHDISWRPGGEDGGRATDFMEGRRFIAVMVRRLLEMPTPEEKTGEQ